MCGETHSVFVKISRYNLNDFFLLGTQVLGSLKGPPHLEIDVVLPSYLTS